MAAAWSKTWTFFENEWHEGNVPLWGVRTHAIWLGSSVFDGARAFEGTAPDLDRHCARVNRSAANFRLKPYSPSGISAAGLRVEIAPNPSANRSVLQFALGSPQPVEIGLYDVKGRRLRTLVSGMQAAGTHRIAFELRTESGRELASGLYLLRVVASGRTTVRRLTVVN